MREIKFKAKRVNDGEWVEATSIQNNPFGKTYLMDTKRLVECYNKEVMPSNIWIEIDPNTLSQFTGLHDRNGKEIYEGDIFMSHVGLKMAIEWQDDYCLYMMRWLSDDYQEKTDAKFLHNSEIIGNIHDK